MKKILFLLFASFAFCFSEEDTEELTADVGSQKECPSIVVQPEQDSAYVDSLASFVIQAAGTGLSYQWYKKGVTVGSNLHYYTFTVAEADNGDSIYCVVTGDTCTAVTSVKTTIRITGSPVISVQPKPTTVAAGQRARFSVTATGTGLTYQWRKNGTNVSGATSANYTLETPLVADSGSLYTVVVTSSNGTYTPSESALLTVHNYGGIKTIEDHFDRANGNLVGGDWYRNISGNTPEIIRNAVTITNGSYSNKVSVWIADSFATDQRVSVRIDSIYTHATNRAMLYINSDSSVTNYYRLFIYYNKLIIYYQSTVLSTINMSIANNDIVTLYSKGDSICARVNNTKVGGVTHTTFRGNRIGLGQYYVDLPAIRVDDFVGGDNSLATPVAKTPINFVSQPNDTFTTEGEIAAILVSVTGSGTLTYQWQISADGTTFTDIVGATNFAMGLPTTLDMNGYKYRCIAQGDTIADTSNNGTLTVYPLAGAKVEAAITLQPIPWFGVEGTTATFSIEAMGTNNTYKWVKGPDSVGNATTYSFTASLADDQVPISCLVQSDTGAPALSTIVQANVSPLVLPPVLVAIADTLTLCTDATTECTYQWYTKTGGAISGATNKCYTIEADSAMYAQKIIYYCIITNTGGDVRSQEWTITKNGSGVGVRNNLQVGLTIQ